MKRRTFIRTGVALTASGIGALGYTTLIEPHWLEIVSRELPVKGLPAALSGRTLAHVSDLHSCSYVSESYLIRSLQRVSALTPDIVAFTGDFITWETNRGDAQLDRMKRMLSHMPRGRLATVGIPGNHEYGPGWKQLPIAAKVLAVAEESGVRVLRNEVHTVSGLDIVGIDDLWSGQADVQRALATRTSGAAIALCHNPDGLDDLDWKNYEGWVLAGHTHGGQCKPPFLPAPVLPVRNRRYVSGEVVVDAKRKLYISRGVGHLLQARFNVRPEITVFTLRAA